jgi:hypothetical protein
MKPIKLGYEIPSGKQVDISLSHLIVCGVTQLSGKTTTLEALIKRSGQKAVVFKTKIGEKSFNDGTIVPAFFKDRSDYEFVRSLIEAYSKEKLFIEKGTLMELCKSSNSLTEIKTSVDNTLINRKLRGFEKEIYIRLQHYLENLIPQIKRAHLSKVLVLGEGINIMNLDKFTEEVQSLIIQSVLDEVLIHHKKVIVVIPEAWKFIPQKYSNPCKRSVESFIRQGAANENFIFVDSQDMAGVDKTVLKQISNWILGFQAERNEVKHTLDQIALPSKSKPNEQDIMTLRKGQFFLSSYDGVKKVYVQPIWIDDAKAAEIAMDYIKLDSVNEPKPKKLKGDDDDMYDDTKLRAAVDELKLELLGVRNEIAVLKDGSSAHTDAIECLQHGTLPDAREKDIIDRILSKLPKGGNPVTYTVAPLEVIKKTFQEEAKQHIIREIAKLDEEQKKILKFVEVQGKGCSITHIIDKCLYLSATSGGTRTRVSQKISTMVGMQLMRKDKNAVAFPTLKEFIKAYASVHGITDQEIQQVYDHIMAGLIK